MNRRPWRGSDRRRRDNGGSAQLRRRIRIGDAAGERWRMAQQAAAGAAGTVFVVPGRMSRRIGGMIAEAETPTQGRRRRNRQRHREHLQRDQIGREQSDHPSAETARAHGRKP